MTENTCLMDFPRRPRFLMYDEWGVTDKLQDLDLLIVPSYLLTACTRWVFASATRVFRCIMTYDRRAVGLAPSRSFDLTIQLIFQHCSLLIYVRTIDSHVFRSWNGLGTTVITLPHNLFLIVMPQAVRKGRRGMSVCMCDLKI